MALRYQISNAITIAYWQQAMNIITEYKTILKKLAKEQPNIQETYIRNSLSMITQPLLYFDDQRTNS